MFSVRTISTLVVLLALWLDFAASHSSPARPVKRLAHPSTLALEILPRRPAHPDPLRPRSLPTPTPPATSPTLLHTDSFRLTLCAFDETFHLHLRPNDDLIHPSARLTYIDALGRKVSQPLLRHTVKVFWGEVIPSHLSADRMRADAAMALPASDALGWARVVVHHQGDRHHGVAPVFEGAFSVKGIVYHVMTKENYLRTKHRLDPMLADDVDELDSSLVIFRDSDIMSAHEELAAATGQPVDIHAELPPQPHSCAHDTLSYNTDNVILQKPLTSPWYNSLLDAPYLNALYGRDDVVSSGGNNTSNFIDTIGDVTGCPKSAQVLYMGVAADCEYTSQFGDASNATTRIITNWNTASALYKSTFNVSLGIVELQISNATCPTTPDADLPWNLPCSSNQTLNERLSIFSQWRGTKGADGAGLWHLMSACPTGSEVGIAWLGTLCSHTVSESDGAFVSGTAVSTSGKVEWQVIAHEIGHNFGAIHDCTDGCNSTTSCCPLSQDTCDANSKYIMSPVADAGEMNFSQCSLGNICSLMQTTSSAPVNTTCLIPASQARNTLSLQMCGNGIVEAGEDCDPGPGVNSTCCDASTCKFAQGAVCDPESSACCTESCAFAPATQVCRPSQNAKCDQAEMCTGASAECPPDVVTRNGMSCGQGMACASGQCTSNSLQCQNLGSSMGLTQSCNQKSSSCQVNCQDPTDSSSCIQLSTMLVDGSPCGYGGSCTNGSCKSGTLFETAKSFYTSNLQIAIPVSVVAGIVSLLLSYALWMSCRGCCCGTRDKEPELLARPPTFVGGSVGPVLTSAQAPPLQRIPSGSSGRSAPTGASYRGETRSQGQWERFGD